MPKCCFEISINHSHKTIFGHRQGCTQARKQAGGKTGVQEHIEGCVSLDEVELAAAQVQNLDPRFMFDWCNFCGSDLKNTSMRI